MTEPEEVASQVHGRGARMAQILVRLVLANQSKVILREDIRAAWLAEYPQHARQKLVTEGAKVRRRRTTYLAGSAHRAGRSAGTRARGYIQQALYELEDLGAIERDGDVVRVVDVPKLVAASKRPST